MPTPFVADAADEAVRSESILNERKAADIIEETALEVDIRAWRAEGLRLLQAASAREDHVPNGARRPCSVLGDASAQAAIEDAVTRMSRTEGVPQRPPRALGSTLAPPPEPPFIPKFRQRTLFFSTVALFFITLFGGFIFKELELERELRDARHARVAPFDTFLRILPGLEPRDKEFVLDELYQGATAVDLRCGECEAARKSYKSYIALDTTDSELRHELGKICRGPEAMRHCNLRFFFLLS